MDTELEDALRGQLVSDRPRYRFGVTSDDSPVAGFSFELLEARPGLLELVEPSRRGYERFYGAVGIAVILLIIPILLGALPWRILLGDTNGLSGTMEVLALFYLVLVLAITVVCGRYLPLLAVRAPRATLPVTVLETQVSESPKIPSRMHVRAGRQELWLTVHAKAAHLRDALALSGQTDSVDLPPEDDG